MLLRPQSQALEEVEEASFAQVASGAVLVVVAAVVEENIVAVVAREDLPHRTAAAALAGEPSLGKTIVGLPSVPLPALAVWGVPL